MEKARLVKAYLTAIDKPTWQQFKNELPNKFAQFPWHIIIINKLKSILSIESKCKIPLIYKQQVLQYSHAQMIAAQEELRTSAIQMYIIQADNRKCQEDCSIEIIIYYLYRI